MGRVFNPPLHPQPNLNIPSHFSPHQWHKAESSILLVQQFMLEGGPPAARGAHATPPSG